MASPTPPGSNTASACILFKLDDDGRRTGIMYPGGNLLEQNIRDDDGRITEVYAKSGGVSGTERLHLQLRVDLLGITSSS